jgi:hypothetical protein
MEKEASPFAESEEKTYLGMTELYCVANILGIIKG